MASEIGAKLAKDVEQMGPENETKKGSETIREHDRPVLTQGPFLGERGDKGVVLIQYWNH